MVSLNPRKNLEYKGINNRITFFMKKDLDTSENKESQRDFRY